MSKRALSDAARLLSKKGASNGGKRAAEGMTPEERKERGRRAAQARWAKRTKKLKAVA